MKKFKIDNLELTDLGFGGAKLVSLSEQDGFFLTDDVLRSGISVVDAHHRYGNAEKIFGQFNNFVKMTKVSSYKLSEYKQLVNNSKKLMKRINIMWVSDLDDAALFESGRTIYNDLKNEFPLLGITTESYAQAYKFMSLHPECKLFMIPVNIGMPKEMIKFIGEAKQNNKYIFAIKPFIDKLLFKQYSIRECLEFIKQINPHVTLFGTSNKEHLYEVVDIWNSFEKEI